MHLCQAGQRPLQVVWAVKGHHHGGGDDALLGGAAAHAALGLIACARCVRTGSGGNQQTGWVAGTASRVVEAVDWVAGRQGSWLGGRDSE